MPTQSLPHRCCLRRQKGSGLAWTQRVGQGRVWGCTVGQSCRQSKGCEPPLAGSCWAPRAAGAQASWGIAWVQGSLCPNLARCCERLLASLPSYPLPGGGTVRDSCGCDLISAATCIDFCKLNTYHFSSSSGKTSPIRKDSSRVCGWNGACT